MKVILDTNILHQEGLNSTRIQILKRLVKNESVEVVIPEIVIKEYNTKVIEDIRAEIKNIESSIDKLHRRNSLNLDSYQVRGFLNLLEKCESEFDKAFTNWLQSQNAKIHEISRTSIVDLFDDYFAGRGAFREKKTRSDIPDAVIFDCIKKIAKDESNEVAVILNDKILDKAASEIENVRTYKTIGDLLEIEYLKDEISKLNAGENQVNSIIEVLNSSECVSLVASYLEEHDLIDVVGEVNNLDVTELPYDLEMLDDMPIFQLNITSLDYFVLGNASYLGEGRFSYNLNAECHATLFFVCEEIEYESLPYVYRKEFRKISSDSNVYISVEGDVKVTYSGVVIFNNIDESTDANQIKVHLSYLDAEQCEITVDVELESIVIEEPS